MSRRHDVGRRVGVVFFHGGARTAPLLLDPTLVASSFTHSGEALHFVHAHLPRAAIVDTASAGPAGIEFARRLRESGFAWPIFLLGHGDADENTIVLEHELGAFYVDGRRVGASELADRVTTAIQGHEALAELRRSARPAIEKRKAAVPLRTIAMLAAAAALIFALLRGCDHPHRLTRSTPTASASTIALARGTTRPTGTPLRAGAEATRGAVDAMPGSTATRVPEHPSFPPLPGPGVPNGYPQIGIGANGARGSTGRRPPYSASPSPTRSPGNGSGRPATRARSSPPPHPSASGAAHRPPLRTRPGYSPAVPPSGRPFVGPPVNTSPQPSGGARDAAIAGHPAAARGSQAAVIARAPGVAARGALAPPGGAAADGHGAMVARTGGNETRTSLAAALSRAIDPDARDDTSIAIDDARGDALFSDNADVPRAPASTIKLLVAAVALADLGSGFRFTTTVGSELPPRAGRLNGDAILRGDGDPTLTSSDLASAALALRARGVRSVARGPLILRAPFAGPEQSEAWPKNDLHVPYAAGSAAITLDGNVAGGLAVHNIPAFVAERFERALTRADIATGAAPRVARDAAMDWIAWRHRSAPLASIVRAMLASSNNLDAEQILRRIGLQRYGVGSADAGLRAERAQLAVWGIPTDGLRLYDASGLAPGDRVTARTLVALLDRFDRGASASPFDRTLPLVGISGTVAPRQLGSARGLVRAKDGHIGGADGLAGYVESAHHGRISFAILSNSARVSRARLEAMQDRIARILASY